MNPNLSQHQFQVFWSKSKNDLKEGRVEQGVSHVTVEDEDSDEGYWRARLTAEQMVAGRGMEPTRVVHRL